MAEPDDTGGTSGGTLEHARRLHRRWPGIVWAVPIAALIIVAFLGVRALASRGTEIVVTFASAEGVTAGDTKVLENGVEVGHVTKVRIAPDGKNVELTMRVDDRAKPALNTASQFWLIGAQPTLTDLQSVRAALAGLIVGLAPGTGGTSTRRFVGLDHPPLVAPGAKGTYYYLEASALGSIQPGAAILYQGQNVGVVTRTILQRLDSFTIEVFVNAPFDRNVRSGAQFWRGSPFKLSLTGGGLQTQLAPPSSVLQGSVQFDLPKASRNGPQAPARTSFPLYDDQNGAAQGPSGPAVLYDAVFTGDAGDLVAGAPVSMLGYKVGEVRSAKLSFRPATNMPYTAATIALFPRKFDIELGGGATEPAWRAATDRVVNRLLGQGYRAALTQTIPLVGGHSVALVRSGPRGPAGLVGGSVNPVIASSGSSGDVSGLISKADAVLTKIERLPVDEIGANIRRLTGNLDRLTSSPELRNSLRSLDATMRRVDRITAEAEPQIRPLVANLAKAAEQLERTAAGAQGIVAGTGANQDQSLPEAIRQMTEAARSIRSLTDYLGRHPEALLRGKSKEK